MPGIKKIIVFLFFFMWCYLALGQDGVTSNTLDKPLLENIHLHLNKTTFFKGEHLWFKAYIQDQIQQLPSSTTTNLHVGVFSKDGKAIAKKVFFVAGGVCNGDFEIDSTFVDDSYTLMAWTNYMKNFEVATPFLQKLTILGSAQKTAPGPQKGISISVNPEGQQLIPNAFNSVGLKVYDEALHPIQTDAIQLVNETGIPIQSNIQTNALGQGRFGFFADPSQSYFLKIQDANGLWITKKLDINVYQGIGLSVDNTGKDVILLKPKLSNALLHSEKKAGFSLAIFNENNISFLQDLRYDEDEIAISVNREELPSGINTAVILDREIQPISQRMFYNQSVSNTSEQIIEVDYCLTENKDSLQLDLILPKGHVTANISMSILPTLSSAYTPNNSITSSFWVQPYLKRRFANGHYFFEKQQRSTAYELDTRLLMEGTEKFNWNRRLIDTVNTTFKIENQIPFHGRVLDSDPKNEKQLSLVSQSFGTIQVLEISSDKRFQGRLPLFEGDSVLISLLNSKGKLRKPKVELYFDAFDQDDFDYSKWLRDSNEIVAAPSLLEVDETLDLTERIIALDEVVVFESARKRTKFQITPEIEGRIIDNEAIKRNTTFANYIRKLGFQIRPNTRNGGIGVFVIDPLGGRGLRPVPVRIEGMLASPGELINMPLSSIETIVYSKIITPHQSPFIALSLRHDYSTLNRKIQFTSVPVSQGFSRTQAYFSPNYPNFSSLLYQKYGAIWWEGQLKVRSEVPTTVTIPLNEQQAVKVFIEGMSADGFLYQADQICSPFKNGHSTN